MDYTEKVKLTGVTMQCPVRIGLKKDGSDLWTLPLEPIVTVKGSKTIVRRNIAKAHGTGTVKEAWSMDDYEVTVSGLFQSIEEGKFPERYVSKLQAFMKPMQPIVIHCKLLDVVGVNLLCVHSWDFPATSGIENQEYVFNAYSDQYFELT